MPPYRPSEIPTPLPEAWCAATGARRFNEFVVPHPARISLFCSESAQRVGARTLTQRIHRLDTFDDGARRLQTLLLRHGSACPRHCCHEVVAVQLKGSITVHEHEAHRAHLVGWRAIPAPRIGHLRCECQEAQCNVCGVSRHEHHEVVEEETASGDRILSSTSAL
jgi:hypothetical protein